ncbi:orotidine-5'-phosphate decarboxylase [Celerinatantimonas yamalensis]|uniref:Orotidine 5'-phosphate decarboxylase n=1 Tax=Celerinatantimonas yamalensis TaxID=559956 RepID=A0ABW9G2L9_9GAMM
MQDPKVIVALDFNERARCLALVEQLTPTACRLKIGKEMFTRFGPEFVRELQSRGFEIFLDLKFHDIPNTVAKAVQAAADLGVWMVNVHASGGRRMMQAAKDALSDYPNPPKLIAVTVLTSMQPDELQEVGYSTELAQQVERLAKLTEQCGLDGVVCSAQEAAQLREYLPESFLLVTPGIRLSHAPEDDQRRIMTPTDALKAGSSYLVVGRPITQSAEPLVVLESINASLAKMA